LRGYKVLSSSTVELNGKRYDAVTGVFLGNSAKRPQSNKVTGNLRGHHQGRSIDGFSTRPSTLRPSPKPQPTVTPTTLRKKSIMSKSPVRTMDGFAHTTNTVVPHQPERSHTLMRGAVQPPKLALKPAIKKQLPVERHAAALHAVAPKLSARQVNPDRLAHAQQVARSQHVAHFNASQAQAPQTASAPQPVVTQPQRHRAVAPPPRREQSEDDMFESAIAQATSHEQKAPKRRLSWKRKLASTGAVVLGLAVIAVFVAYLNLPTIEVNLASAQAGFHATMPNYKSLGYNLNGPVKTSGGTIAMSFTSGDSQFTLTQEASNWDNQTLMETLASQSDSLPKTIQSDGRTIYMTHTDEATWVNGGIRYDLTGNANLNNQEITSVADSM
jgi:hypothetical protein